MSEDGQGVSQVLQYPQKGHKTAGEAEVAETIPPCGTWALTARLMHPGSLPGSPSVRAGFPWLLMWQTNELDFCVPQVYERLGAQSDHRTAAIA